MRQRPVTAAKHPAPPPPPPQDIVTLSMPIDYARTLESLIGFHVLGDPLDTYRQHTTAVHDALVECRLGAVSDRFTPGLMIVARELVDEVVK